MASLFPQNIDEAFEMKAAFNTNRNSASEVDDESCYFWLFTSVTIVVSVWGWDGFGSDELYGSGWTEQFFGVIISGVVSEYCIRSIMGAILEVVQKKRSLEVRDAAREVALRYAVLLPSLS
ncbi:hypothetical protein FNV43_RR02107 [Rhamnella rubrinervis]|uniref:Uncharacterized protein n=1 Tax=Rhamnella rubrinervis TaxID=2594499 RepID=A0A8K0HS68_9ROSA|nr:hypothetical protein FNV43_RR02107 [Rhamnella rubrinervis]